MGASVVMTVSACGTVNSLEPIGIGPDRDELKRSPCACTELPQNYADWFRS